MDMEPAVGASGKEIGSAEVLLDEDELVARGQLDGDGKAAALGGGELPTAGVNGEVIEDQGKGALVRCERRARIGRVAAIEMAGANGPVVHHLAAGVVLRKGGLPEVDLRATVRGQRAGHARAHR